MNVIIEYFNQQCKLQIGLVIHGNDNVGDNYGDSPNQIFPEERQRW